MLGYMGILRHSSTITQKEAPLTSLKRSFPEVELTARAAIVYDPITQKVLYDKEADLPLPLASLTKIMTAIVAVEQYGNNSPKSFADAQGQHTWTLITFLEKMLVSSSNYAAQAVTALANDTYDSNRWSGESIFVEAMNATADTLGLRNTLYLNTSGLDIDDTTAGAYGTARETATLLWYGASSQPEIFRATSNAIVNLKSREGALTDTENTNIIVERLPAVLASKTGFTDLAGGNLAIITDAGINHPIVIVVMGSGEAERFSDVERLSRATLQYFASDIGDLSKAVDSKDKTR